jgi:hypothetical protein
MLSEISEGKTVKRLRKFTHQETYSHTHSKELLGKMHCFQDSVHCPNSLCINKPICPEDGDRYLSLLI